MRYVLAILIITAGFWYWMQPREGSVFTGTGGNTMSDAEKAYYIQIFNHAMSHTYDDQHYPWESFNSKGSITPLKTYASKSKSLCRRYSETFVIGSYGGQQEGVTCKRKGKAGWCRLKIGDAETCALEDRALALTFGELNVGNVDIGTIQLGDMEVTIPTMGIDINIPSLPDAPDKAPDFLPRERKEGETSAEWMVH